MVMPEVPGGDALPIAVFCRGLTLTESRFYMKAGSECRARLLRCVGCVSSLNTMESQKKTK